MTHTDWYRSNMQMAGLMMFIRYDIYYLYLANKIFPWFSFLDFWNRCWSTPNRELNQFYQSTALDRFFSSKINYLAFVYFRLVNHKRHQNIEAKYLLTNRRLWFVWLYVSAFPWIMNFDFWKSIACLLEMPKVWWVISQFYFILSVAPIRHKSITFHTFRFCFELDTYQSSWLNHMVAAVAVQLLKTYRSFDFYAWSGSSVVIYHSILFTFIAAVVLTIYRKSENNCTKTSTRNWRTTGHACCFVFTSLIKTVVYGGFCYVLACNTTAHHGRIVCEK